MFFASKIEHVVKPLIKDLAQRHQLNDQWRAILKSALLCCPLLTMNLADANRFPASITLLGVCYAVEMGLTSQGNTSLLDAQLHALAEEIA
jgi:hypothetical protein